MLLLATVVLYSWSMFADALTLTFSNEGINQVHFCLCVSTVARETPYCLKITFY